MNRILLFLISFLSIFSFSTLQSQTKEKYTIVLDAGHGGKDAGASRGEYLEKKIALKLVLKIGKIIKKDKDIEVFYTRTKDEFIELHKRAAIANDKEADLFVSIHCNANNSDKPHGAETYVLGLNGNEENLEIVKKENEVILLESDYKSNYDYDPNSPEAVIGLSVLQEENLDASLAFAGIVQENFRSLKRYDRSVKQANFLVLRETVMPSVLIELGFLSNEAEGKFLNTNSGQQIMAGAVAKAIRNYVSQLKVNRVDINEVEEVVPVKKKEVEKKVVKKKKEVKAEMPKDVTKKVTKLPKEKTKTFTLNHIEYKVQIAASKKYISPEPYNFKGLKNVEMKTVNDYYKYYYGNVSNFEDIKPFLEEAKEVGHTDSFVVAFEDGNKISVNEALKKQ